MKLYCRGLQILAVHDDDQDVPASAYGEDVEIVEVASYGDIPAGYWSWIPGLGGPPPPPED